MPASASNGDRTGACDTSGRLGGGTARRKQQREIDSRHRVATLPSAVYGTLTDAVPTPAAAGYQIDTDPFARGHHAAGDLDR